MIQHHQGDTKFLNGEVYVFYNNQWIAVMNHDNSTTTLWAGGQPTTQVKKVSLTSKAKKTPTLAASASTSLPQRTYLLHKDLDNETPLVAYGTHEDKGVVEVSSQQEANLISSKVVGSKNRHAPVLDFDLPIQVYPSSQVGHYHLYIDKDISWNHYVRILKALKAAGLVEAGYVDAALENGYSAVRPVGVVKETAPNGVEVLVENAQLRQEKAAYVKDQGGLVNKVNYLSGLVDGYIQRIDELKQENEALRKSNNAATKELYWS